MTYNLRKGARSYTKEGCIYIYHTQRRGVYIYHTQRRDVYIYIIHMET